jgi:hypothetical protein
MVVPTVARSAVTKAGSMAGLLGDWKADYLVEQKVDSSVAL